MELAFRQYAHVIYIYIFIYLFIRQYILDHSLDCVCNCFDLIASCCNLVVREMSARALKTS